MSGYLAELSAKAFGCLLPFAWLAFGIAVLVLTPMAFFRTTRPQAGFGLIVASWVFGVTTWLLGAAVTFSTYSWPALLIGLLFAGVGVVPIGIFAAFFSVKSAALGITMIIMTIVVFVSKGVGASLMASGD